MTSDRKFAILSVSDKTGLLALAETVCGLGYEILSSGGTAKFLRDHGLSCTDVSQVTGQQEIFGGRVKTLHPKIHGGILFRRGDALDIETRCALGIPSIDLVVVNLYPFQRGAKIRGPEDSDAIELIDIGGPALIRAAAKNFASVWVVVDPKDYSDVCLALQGSSDQLSARHRLSAKAFKHTARYDDMIAQAFEDASTPPSETLQQMRPALELRYGENPQQEARFLRPKATDGLPWTQYGGKDLSYNNLLDLFAAVNIVENFESWTACVVKHNNPCGAASLRAQNESPESVLARALKADSKSAFGGIVACNFPLSKKSAEILHEFFLECVIAPRIDLDARDVFSKKKNLRCLEADFRKLKSSSDIKSCFDGLLEQDVDSGPDQTLWTIPTLAQASAEDLAEARFALNIAANVKSNAIVIVKGRQTIGIGAGQMSRIDSVNLAIRKAREAGHDLFGATAASDGFFPFSDSVASLAEAGVRCIIQPGGSVRDPESIAVANQKSIPMIFAGLRHFKH